MLEGGVCKKIGKESGLSIGILAQFVGEPASRGGKVKGPLYSFQVLGNTNARRRAHREIGNKAQI